MLRVLRGYASLRALGERRCAAPRVAIAELQLTQPAAELLLRRAVLDARVRCSELFRSLLDLRLPLSALQPRDGLLELDASQLLERLQLAEA